jgi:hypothetical protein
MKMLNAMTINTPNRTALRSIFILGLTLWHHWRGMIEHQLVGSMAA